ncbi:transcription initiation factor IIE subunit alpha, partial [Trifolium medium]|nr:transcription initiation factor IIE subunit alpha [Trifolium medium]
ELEEAAKNPQDANAADDPSSSTSIRKVGDKYKREEDDDGTEWEEAPARGTFSNPITLKFGSLKYKSRIHTCIYDY